MQVSRPGSPHGQLGCGEYVAQTPPVFFSCESTVDVFCSCDSTVDVVVSSMLLTVEVGSTMFGGTGVLFSWGIAKSNQQK
jgi:hypothetical protein